MKRRNFLKSSIVGLTATQIPLPLYADISLPDNPFNLGIVYDVQISVELWIMHGFAVV